MSRSIRPLGGVALLALTYACSVPQTKPEPVPTGSYSFAPTPPCMTPGSAKLTLAVVSPLWQNGAQPTAMSAQLRAVTAASQAPIAEFETLASAMRADFLQLVTCRGFLAKGPFDSFESMVFPDRQASNLLLEPEMLIRVDVTSLERKAPNFVAAVLASHTSLPFAGTATVGGRVNLNLKEPVTNTRMWTRNIELPPQTFTFETRGLFPADVPELTVRTMLAGDAGFVSALIPQLESMYGKVFQAAQSYLNKDELQSVATQAVDVRKKAAIAVPPL